MPAARRGGRFLGNSRRQGDSPARRSPPRLARVGYRSKSRRGGCKSWWLLMTQSRHAGSLARGQQEQLDLGHESAQAGSPGRMAWLLLSNPTNLAPGMDDAIIRP